MLEIDVDGGDEFFAVEEAADGNFDAGDAALELEDLNFFGEGAFVGFEHADNVVAIFFFANEEAALDVLGFPAGLDDVAVGIFLNELNGFVEVVEFLVRNDGDAGFLEFFLAEGAIVFKIVGVDSAADDGLASGAKSLGASALAEGVVKDDDIGPFVSVFFPVDGFGDEAVSDVALLFVVDEIADVVTFFKNLPGDVADEAGKRWEKKFSFVHEMSLRKSVRRRLIVNRVGESVYYKIEIIGGRVRKVKEGKDWRDGTAE